MHGAPQKRRSQEAPTLNLEAERKELLREIAQKQEVGVGVVRC